MKIKQANAGALTNFEVTDFLRSRKATPDPLGCFGAVAPSECKVFEYLLQTAACVQSREVINQFVSRCEKFKLTKAKKMNIINLRPSQPILYAIENFGDDDDKLKELFDLADEVLPPPPEQPEEEAAGDEEEMQS